MEGPDQPRPKSMPRYLPTGESRLRKRSSFFPPSWANSSPHHDGCQWEQPFSSLRLTTHTARLPPWTRQDPWIVRYVSGHRWSSLESPECRPLLSWSSSAFSLRWKEDRAASPSLWGSGSQPLVGTCLGVTTGKELQETTRISEDNPVSTPNFLGLCFSSQQSLRKCALIFYYYAEHSTSQVAISLV